MTYSKLLTHLVTFRRNNYYLHVGLQYFPICSLQKVEIPSSDYRPNIMLATASNSKVHLVSEIQVGYCVNLIVARMLNALFLTEEILKIETRL